MDMKVKHFFETQFKPYAVYDSERSIANVIDGQKITSRKVLYTCVKRTNTDIKVAQLCSNVAYETAYHHGEQGISGVITNLAQDFTGSNNINLLEPIGQFGNRLSPIASAARYIFTKLTPEFKILFKKEDELILEHNFDDDQQIEPKFYLPILPVILINGSQGIGTGFASKVLSYNPNDLKSDIINILKNKKRNKLIPWYKNFKGEIYEGENVNQWIIKGKLEIVNTTLIKITELPVGMYLDDIKAILNKLKESGMIKDYDDNSTEEKFDIDVNCPRTTTSLTDEKLYELFKLITKDTENLTLWNTNNKLQVFESASDIVTYFTNFRLIKYEERRQALIKQVTEEIFELDEKIRFINFYLDNTSLFRNTPKKELLELLLKNNFTLPDKMLSLAIYNLTKDKIDELLKTLEDKKIYLDTLNKTNAKEMYLKELTELKF